MDGYTFNWTGHKWLWLLWGSTTWKSWNQLSNRYQVIATSTNNPSQPFTFFVGMYFFQSTNLLPSVMRLSVLLSASFHLRAVFICLDSMEWFGYNNTRTNNFRSHKNSVTATRTCFVAVDTWAYVRGPVCWEKVADRESERERELVPLVE